MKLLTPEETCNIPQGAAFVTLKNDKRMQYVMLKTGIKLYTILSNTFEILATDYLVNNIAEWSNINVLNTDDERHKISRGIKRKLKEMRLSDRDQDIYRSVVDELDRSSV